MAVGNSTGGRGSGLRGSFLVLIFVLPGEVIELAEGGGVLQHLQAEVRGAATRRAEGCRQAKEIRLPHLTSI